MGIIKTHVASLIEDFGRIVRFLNSSAFCMYGLICGYYQIHKPEDKTNRNKKVITL